MADAVGREGGSLNAAPTLEDVIGTIQPAAKHHLDENEEKEKKGSTENNEEKGACGLLISTTDYVDVEAGKGAPAVEITHQCEPIIVTF